MAAESLPLAGAASPSALPSWELEAWYQDLQEVLAAAEPGGYHPLPGGAEQEGLAELTTLDGTALRWSVDGTGGTAAGCELDATLATELLELLGPESAASTEPAVPPPGSASSGSSPAQTGTEDEEGATPRRGAKRKRHSGEAAGRELAKRREQANEQRVLELTAHNEQLREEIQRLSAEVERTRAALIDRIVNLRQT
ncbi:DNA damage-inducible transcript 3 protein [Struthio camelus]|uniref:DNA damage-inducible transcript 3 protein n=1 Tax=Struthio camelus TaxID=8801 RepID=UPI003603F03A